MKFESIFHHTAKTSNQDKEGFPYLGAGGVADGTPRSARGKGQNSHVFTAGKGRGLEDESRTSRRNLPHMVGGNFTKFSLETSQRDLCVLNVRETSNFDEFSFLESIWTTILFFFLSVCPP